MLRISDKWYVLVLELVHELPKASVAKRGVKVRSAPAGDDVLLESALAQLVVEVASRGLGDREVRRRWAFLLHLLVVARKEGNHRVWSPKFAALKAVKSTGVPVAKVSAVVNCALACSGEINGDGSVSVGSLEPSRAS